MNRFVLSVLVLALSAVPLGAQTPSDDVTAQVVALQKDLSDALAAAKVSKGEVDALKKDLAALAARVPAPTAKEQEQQQLKNLTLACTQRGLRLGTVQVDANGVKVDCKRKRRFLWW